MKESCVQLSWKCFKKMAEMFQTTNPALSRYYLSRSVKMKRKAALNMSGTHVIPKESTHCFHCFTVFKPGNYSVRIKPKKKMSRYIRKLLVKSKDKQKQLGSLQKKMLDRFLHSKNMLIISCFTCKKLLKVECQSNAERIEQIQLLDRTPKPIVEKVTTKKQRKKEKRKQLNQKKKFSKFLFDNEEEAEVANMRNKTSTEDCEQCSVPSEEMGELKPSENPNRQPFEIVMPNVSSKIVGNAMRTSIKSRNAVPSKKNTCVFSTVKSIVSSKKKKGKYIHQQLQKVLENDKNKVSGNSLQDFLSSL